MKFILATIIFALDVWAIASIINSGESGRAKLIWILLVAFLPVVGLIRDIESAIGTEVRGYTLTIRYICPKCRAKNAQ